MLYVWTHGPTNSIKMASDMTLSQFDLIGFPAGNETLSQPARGEQFLLTLQGGKNVPQHTSLVSACNVFLLSICPRCLADEHANGTNNQSMNLQFLGINQALNPIVLIPSAHSHHYSSCLIRMVKCGGFPHQLIRSPL